MIAKKSKFPLRTDFVQFRSRAQKAITPHTSCLILQTTNLSRLGVIVPKKVNKLATTRNFLKRLTYDTIWPLIKDKQLDCVIVYKPLPLTKSPITKLQIITEFQAISFENLRI